MQHHVRVAQEIRKMITRDVAGNVSGCSVCERLKLLFVACLLASQMAWGQLAQPAVELSKPALQAAQVAVVVNESSPGSLEVGEYYLRARGIPARNLVKLRFPASSRKLSFEEFVSLRDEINRQLDASIEAVVFVWTTPYAVECASITGAYTLGIQPEFCAKTCNPSRPSRYFDSRSSRPYQDFGLRLSMLLPVESVEKAKALIDRGVLSDFKRPHGKVFLLKTSDVHRNTRARFFPASVELSDPPVSIRTINADKIEKENDIILYLTGAVSVPALDTLGFLPGAVADHLTSFGGDLLGTRQMSSLRWLDAGATGSYGTVSEPCNHWQKFPNPIVLLKHYLSGTSLIEAYWRSVAWPMQGLFIGEPLATPYFSRLPVQSAAE
jgi:uncharacterized protein (TIGR03790 family)